MKLLWFHLMPYSELPDDFREQHPAVWVDIDSPLCDPAQAQAVYSDFLDELELADEVGFHGICVNDHHSVSRENEPAARLSWPLGDRGLSQRLDRIVAPTLLVWGAEDAMIPASHAKRFSEGIAGAGRTAEIDAPDAVAEAVHGFLG